MLTAWVGCALLVGAVPMEAVAQGLPADVRRTAYPPADSLLPGALSIGRTLLQDGWHLLSSPARMGERAPEFGLCTAIIAAAYSVDAGGNRRIGDSRFRFLDRNDEIYERLGRVQTQHLVGGGIALAGLLRQNRAWLRKGILVWETSVFTVLVTGALKKIAGRDRPFQTTERTAFDALGEGTSFPSSHAAQAFGTAAVLAEGAGPLTGFLAYGGAGLVALARMRGGYHWLSDIAAGAVLGTSIGRTLAKRHPLQTQSTRQQAGGLSSRVFLEPAPSPGGFLLRVRCRF